MFGQGYSSKWWGKQALFLLNVVYLLQKDWLKIACFFESTDECGKSKYFDAATSFGRRKREANQPSAAYVIGGTNTRAHEFPWQVSIQTKPGGASFRHFCGGTIIHPYFILTAAHCVVEE